MADKYIKIDKDSGKPEYINKGDGQKIPGVPGDDDLCFIEFKEVQIPKAEKGDDDSPKEAKNVPGAEFNCKPTDKCNEKNKEVNAKRTALQKQIAERNKDIADQDKIINDKKKTPQEHTAAKTKKEAAEKKKGELQHELHGYPPNCVLKYSVAAGGKEPTSHRVTYDDLKANKVEYIFCLCQKVTVPDAPKKDH